jgi:hypothetical protein
MLRRWNGRAYEAGLLISILDLILESMDCVSKIKERGGRRPKRPVKLYVEVLVFKEMSKLSLRYAESCSSTYFHERIPRSTLSYWENHHGFLIKHVLEVLFGILCLLSYDYTVLDSTKFTDWHKKAHEAFLCVRVGEALLPVHVGLTTSEVGFSEGVPSGSGFALADGAFDAKPVLNDLASKGYIPMVKPGKVSPGGYGARIRDGLFDQSTYRLRAVGEGVFGALTVEFGDRMKTRRREAAETRTLLRLVVYCLKILVRWWYG